MSKPSGGLLMYRIRAGAVEVLLVHPGGPFWRNRDEGVWSIPKGEIGEGEDALTAARREFEEETGISPVGPFVELGSVTQRGGKTVWAWAFEGDCDPAAIVSNTFEMEWPPRSGKLARFPEIDRAGFFALGEARRRVNRGQVALIEELLVRLGLASSRALE